MLIDYYAMFDADKGTIRWAPHKPDWKDNGKKDVQVSDVPSNPKGLKVKVVEETQEEEEEPAGDMDDITFIVIYLVLVAVIYYFGIYMEFKDKSEFGLYTGIYAAVAVVILGILVIGMLAPSAP